MCQCCVCFNTVICLLSVEIENDREGKLWCVSAVFVAILLFVYCLWIMIENGGWCVYAVFVAILFCVYCLWIMIEKGGWCVYAVFVAILFLFIVCE